MRHTAAIDEALASELLRCQAAELGERVRKEDEVARAVDLIEGTSG